MRSFHRCAFVFLIACVANSPFARSETRESVDLAIPAPPIPASIDGREWLVYELHLTNFCPEALRVSRVDVFGDGAMLQSFESDDLAQRMAVPGSGAADARWLRPGQRGIAYLEVPVRAHSPRRLRHRVVFSSEAETGAREVMGDEIPVRAKSRLALGAPLRGGPWAAVYAWEWPRGHRRVFYTLDGRARLPGRFAIDWVRKDSQGQSARGDPDVVQNSLGYGAEVLAVADARVAAVRDGMKESVTVSGNPNPTLDEAAGNYVSLKLADGRFAVYEHLKPGSIRVAIGDRVRRGAVIAALGFTGSSTEPHLHFHVADNAAPLLGEGLPFELEEFRVQGEGPGQSRKKERPAPGALVNFDRY